MKAALALSVAVIGCLPVHGRQSSSCWAAPLADTALAQAPLIAELSGRFLLTLVDTTNPSGNFVSTHELRLARPDSATRARARERRLGHYVRQDLQQVGTATAPGFARPDTAEIDAGILYLGCRDCTDASPDLLRIVETTTSGFRGTWRNDETGIGVPVDERGRPRPNPTGYFCATRI